MPPIENRGQPAGVVAACDGLVVGIADVGARGRIGDTDQAVLRIVALTAMPS